MVETSCDVGRGYADIFFNKVTDIGVRDAHNNNVSFDLNGVTVPIPPQDYVIGYDRVDAVIFEISHQHDDAGRLSFRVRHGSTIDLELIGVVQRPCWEATKRFLMTTKLRGKIIESDGAPG
jgi:hypothetical protein